MPTDSYRNPKIFIIEPPTRAITETIPKTTATQIIKPKKSNTFFLIFHAFPNKKRCTRYTISTSTSYIYLICSLNYVQYFLQFTRLYVTVHSTPFAKRTFSAFPLQAAIFAHKQALNSINNLFFPKLQGYYALPLYPQ